MGTCHYAIMTDMQAENINVPSAPTTPENNPNIPAPNMDRLPPLSSPEAGLSVGGERHEQAAELSAAQSDAASAAVPATMLPQPIVVDDTATGGSGIAGATPLVASNDDLIEKEWVDRAKEIIGKTPDDPHARGQQVNALQKDYLRKRYGKELGAAS